MKIRDIQNRIMPIIDDAHWAEMALDKEDNPFTRRAYVRNVFAMIEGITWALKETILLAPTRNGNTKVMLPGERELLSDKTYELKGNGEIREQTKYLRLPENIKFTFSMISKYFKVDVDIGVGAKGWQDFLLAQEVRNRITHPKTVSEFSVSDEDIRACKETCSWFNNLIVAFFKGIVNK